MKRLIKYFAHIIAVEILSEINLQGNNAICKGFSEELARIREKEQIQTDKPICGKMSNRRFD